MLRRSRTAASRGLRNSSEWASPLSTVSKLSLSQQSFASSSSSSRIWSTSTIGHFGTGNVEARRYLTSNDPFAALTKDHREVQALCDKILATENRKDQNDLSRELIKNMCVHCSIEEVHVYPLINKFVPPKPGERKDDQLSQRLIREHKGLKTLLGELEDNLNSLAVLPEGRWPPFPTTILEDIRKYQLEHAQEEEEQLFTKLKTVLDPVQQTNLMEKLENEKAWAPLHPRPNMPETPPFSTMAARAAGSPQHSTLQQPDRV